MTQRKSAAKARPESPTDTPRSRGRRPRLVLGLASIVVASIAAILLLPSPALNLAGLSGGSPRPPTAAIVDQLGATQPNQEFAEAATDLLEEAGYVVDYYPPGAVTVDFYRDLPRGDYDLLILRTHSTAEISKGEEDVSSVSLFTNEPYSRDLYYDEQVQGRIGFAEYREGGPQYFGITAEFVRNSMNGKFDGTTIVMMGCQGLLNQEAAKAFADRGAGDYISWDGLVSAAHTDQATESLLRRLAIEDLPAGEAVALTRAELGPDPTYGSELVLAP